MAGFFKRRRWWLVAGLALLVLGGILLVASRDPGVRYGWVRNGMTHQEVEDLLGPPDGMQPYWSDGCPCYRWRYTDGSVVWISMDRDGRVRQKERFGYRPMAPFLNRLRDLGIHF